MEKLEEKLWRTLQRLTKDQFRSFKWFLKKRVLEGVSGIPEAQLEDAQLEEVVDLLVQNYPGPGALKVTLEVLGKISRNDLVKDLLEASKGKIGFNRVQKASSVWTVLQGVCLFSCSDDLRAGEERTKELKEEMEQMIHDRRMKMEEIRRSAAVSRISAERYISESERTFQVLLQTLRRSQNELMADLKEKQKTTQRQADAFIQELEQEIQQLAKTSQEAAPPSAPTGSWQPLPRIPATRDWAEVSVPPPPYGRTVASTLRDLEKRLSKEKEQLVAWSKLIRAQEYFRDVTLDPDTANPFLVLSDDRKRVHCGSVPQNLAHHPRRFQTACNVLGWPGCSSGRFYFQVQVGALASWDVGVARESAPRSGSITTGPQNGFWTIGLRDGTEYKAPGLELRPKEPPRKVGVLVDYEEGRVAFFDVDSAHLLHQFTQCCFSEQLLPFFSPGRPSHRPQPPSLIICPVSDNL